MRQGKGFKINFLKDMMDVKRGKGKRGISPIVATVILISLVVTLSIIVWVFLSGFTKELVIKEQKSVDAICQDDVEISAVVDVPGRGLLVSNEGNVPIAGVELELRKPGDAQRKFFSCPLEPGKTSDDINCPFPLGEFRNTLLSGCETATVIPVLLGTGQKSGKHQKSPCELKSKTFTC